ncbi:ribonuclease III [Parendozoicomonas haliclonae]|uniref:Ribonuclease 3 n=1 Tax=Parendozoicomonas haliclonae TaxID=1960125 RepID=A0A1X7AQC9_9GAMM|nr:ribonuclease III [Parendozoicomonas haliclonae]SMA50455.1 Ribonuclease 3 [Parendozoicomonas haliclonae]
MKSSLDKLERRLGYTFKNPDLAVLALTHRSYGGKNNERLEFLGDSIVNFLIAEDLYQRFPEAREGQLSRLRALMVRGRTLAELAREFELGDFLLLGSGELKSGGFRRESILADVVEALLGAIYLDSGMDTCRERVQAWFSSRLATLSVTDQHNKDPKTRLQEFLQSQQQKLPEYELLSIEGKAHAQTFKVSCLIDGQKPTEGEGSSRRIAEQQSARRALVALGVEVEE